MFSSARALRMRTVTMAPAETPFLSLTLLKQYTNIDLQHPEHCLESYLNRKHQALHIHNASKFIRRGISTTSARKQHRDTAPKGHIQGGSGYRQLCGVVMCALSTGVG